ncbi:uncharacterized protein LOC110031719 isoform X2 [Phalaenopsis equestris]|nr:uncharacterized protein LOC110031719 isoform X2 [Phalaenopsis equestris]
MDHLNLLEDSTNKAVDTIFTDFMTICAKHEELFDAGKGFLRGFYQALEILRRTLHSKSLSVVDKVIKANCTDKLNEYVEAGFTKHENAVQTIIKLHFCKVGLEDHLMKAKVLLDELESLKHNAVGIATRALDGHFSNCISNSLDDTKTQQSCSVQEDAKESALLIELMSRVPLMSIIYGMLKLEFTMQEKIIKSLDLKASSSVLESYCLFWELRPDIDDNALHLAWKYVSGHKS